MRWEQVKGGKQTDFRLHYRLNKTAKHKQGEGCRRRLLSRHTYARESCVDHWGVGMKCLGKSDLFGLSLFADLSLTRHCVRRSEKWLVCGMGAQSWIRQYYYKIFHKLKLSTCCNFPWLVASRAKPGIRYLFLLLSRAVILIITRFWKFCSF